MPNGTQDRFGMTLTTSSAAAAEFLVEGIDRLLSQNHGPELKFQEAIELDEGFAMAHGGLAYWYQQRALPEEARKTERSYRVDDHPTHVSCSPDLSPASSR